MRTILFLILLTVSCSNDNKSGPVDITYGEDICERCKMIISEKNFSSQIIGDNGTVYNFDDIGGMIHYMSENKITPGSVEIYVKDYINGKWLLYDKAVYVATDQINTPMNFGIIAFSDNESADAFISTHSGRKIESFTYVMEYVVNNT